MFRYNYSEDVKSITSKPYKGSISITLIGTGELDHWKNKLDRKQQSWVKVNTFKGNVGEVLIFSTIEGGIDHIVAGKGAGDYSPWLFSRIAETLPEGSYHLKENLSEHDANFAAFGWAMADYKYDHYLKDKDTKSVILTVGDNCNLTRVNSWIRGTILARDLVNTPTCDMGPDDLALVAERLAKQFKAKIEITRGEELLIKGYNTIHTVGRAAEKEPCLIDIKWGNEKAPKITLVGKGVCFDTGGLDIKPSGAMVTMKKDMGGAAHVLGLGQMIMESGLDIRLRILIPAVENNIAGNAFRPGDIIKSYKGTTIEVGNTDAEGRLVLCDALALASEEIPELIIDFATLTGAARVALGTEVSPYFTNNSKLSAELLKLSENEYDPLWPLPLYLPYEKLLNSTLADINNIGSTGFGGAITAALFLKSFVTNDIPWVHLDVYAWNASAAAGKPKGGEAMGIRTVFEYLVKKYSK